MQEMDCTETEFEEHRLKTLKSLEDLKKIIEEVPKNSFLYNLLINERSLLDVLDKAIIEIKI